MRHRVALLWYLTLSAGLSAAALGFGQTGERPLQKLFGSAPPKGGAAKPAEDARRRTEIEIELAWLADPITFPYFLEARLDGSTLSVRGYVPDKAVRTHVLKLARLHTTVAVVDALKEHPSLLVRPTKETAVHLQTAVASALKEALPRQHQRVQAQCAADGTVTLRGPIASAEEKLAASVALRRLYGCTSVQNLTQLPGEPDASKAKAPAVAKDGSSKAKPTPAEPHAVIGPLVPKQDDPPAGKPSPKPPEPKLGPPLATAPTPKQEPAPVAGPKLSLSTEKLAALQKRVLEACPGARDAKLTVTPMNKLQIDMTVRSDDQIATVAGQVYGMPEMMDYREELELHFTVGQ